MQNTPTHKPQVVLCIDDEKIGLRVRQTLLERAGYQVLTAETGSDGLAAFAANAVDAVVLDYSMPGMHGGEVARRMREDKPHVPILLLSAYMDLPGEVVCLVDQSMTKGEGAPEFLGRLDHMLSPSLPA